MSITNNFGWSLHKLNQYRSCQRRYYHQYYTYWNGWKNDSCEESRTCYFLKNLEELYFFVGNLTHSYIADILKKNLNDLSCMKPALELSDEEKKEELYKKIKNNVDKKFDYSSSQVREKTSKDILRSKGSLKNLGFFEHYSNTIDDNKESIIKKSITDQVYTNIVSFVDSDVYEYSLKNLLFSQNHKLPHKIEKEEVDFDKDTFLHLWNGYGVQCFAKPDLYFTTEKKRIVIIDWKTAHRPLNSPINTITSQLMLYGYKLFKEISDSKKNDADFFFEAYEVYLPSCAMVGGVLTDYHFENIVSKINEEVEFLSTLLVGQDIKDNKPKDIDTFKQSSNEDMCKKCKYKEICSK